MSILDLLCPASKLGAAIEGWPPYFWLKLIKNSERRSCFVRVDTIRIELDGVYRYPSGDVA